MIAAEHPVSPRTALQQSIIQPQASVLLRLGSLVLCKIPLYFFPALKSHDLLFIVVVWLCVSDSVQFSSEFSSVQSLRHYFANKGPSSQSYGFSSSHVWMWELDYKESCAPKNWCFLTLVLENTLESPLDSTEIQPVHPKGSHSWIFIGRTDAEAETQVLWPPDGKSWLIWKERELWCWERLKAGREGDRGWMVEWHHQLNGHEFE